MPPKGLGSRLDQMNAWLDANCGANGWTSTPSSTLAVVNDALAICFGDATLASAFVARWVRNAEGRDRGWGVSGPDDELTPRIGAALHKTLWAHMGILDTDGTTAPDEGAT